MRKFFYSIWKYVLDLIIFSGFPIVGYFASENGKKLLGENHYSIIKDYEFLLYILISIMYLIYKVLITKSSFTNQSDIDEIRTTVTLSLSQIVGKYIHYIKIHR